MKSLFWVLICITFLSAQAILPVTLDIMTELQTQYRSGEIDSYISQVINKSMSEEDSIRVIEEINQFFESNQFVETGAQYLTSLFTERELNEIMAVLKDSSLRNDPNFSGAAKMDQMMNRLKPYIIKYLRITTSR